MVQVKFVNVEYEPSRSIEVQGNRSKIETYLSQGFYVKEDRNGYWVLIKPAKVIVYVIGQNDKYAQGFNFKQEILDYRRRQRISQKLIDEFCEDAKAGKIQFYLNNGQLVIQ